MPEHSCFVKGDAKVASIAAASILAKTHRDEFMLKAAKTYPEYGWDTNMGYPTVAHRKALTVQGPPRCTEARSSGPLRPRRCSTRQIDVNES